MKVERVLIKISGEALSGAEGIFDSQAISGVCSNIKNVVDSGVKVCLVVGGGNIIRGRDFQNCRFMITETADTVGMLSTVMNCVIMRDALASCGMSVAAVSTLHLPFNILSNDIYTLNRLLPSNDVVIFCGGIGLPYFSTDTVAVVAAIMARCNVLLKATKTDGIYDLDPRLFANAQYIPELTHSDAIRRCLSVMDQTAFEVASKYKLPIYVFSASEPNCFARAINGEIKMSVAR
ncbi:MAG: hypothetical protein LBJ42_00520 [Holosporales bacterium]|nr:hypothetical protein [Holosporales bacterium]